MGEQAAQGISLTDEEVAMVVQAIREGRVRTLDDLPYDAEVWDEEAVRDWLERTHLPRRARQIVSTLRGGRNIKSRPVAPTVDIALRVLVAHIHTLQTRIDALQHEVSELRQYHVSDMSSVS